MGGGAGGGWCGRRWSWRRVRYRSRGAWLVCVVFLDGWWIDWLINSLSCRCVSPIPLPPPTRHNRYGHTLTQVDAHTLALFGGLSHRHGRPVAFSDLWLIYVRATANHIQIHPPACVRRSIAYPAHTIKSQQRFYRCSPPRRTAPPRCGSPSPASPSSGGPPRRGALGVCCCMCYVLLGFGGSSVLHSPTAWCTH